MGINDRNNTDQYDNSLNVIRGHDDLYSAKVDSENRLWVNSKSTYAQKGLYSLNKNLRVADMNASVGGVARGTSITNATWVDVFNFSGEGYLLHTLINFETFTDWLVRIIIDGSEIFGASGILTDDMTDDAVYDLDSNQDDHLGLEVNPHKILSWHCPLVLPMYFATSCVVKIKRNTGAPNKKFKAGLIQYTVAI